MNLRMMRINFQKECCALKAIWISPLWYWEVSLIAVQSTDTQGTVKMSSESMDWHAVKGRLVHLLNLDLFEVHAWLSCQWQAHFTCTGTCKNTCKTCRHAVEITNLSHITNFQQKFQANWHADWNFCCQGLCSCVNHISMCYASFI